MPRLHDAEIVHTIAARHSVGLTADPTRSDHYNKVMAARAYRAIRTDVTAHIETGKKDAATKYNAAYRRAFSIDGLPGDPATLHAALRAARAEAATHNRVGTLEYAIDDARRLGDEITVRALAARAVELQDVAAINRYDLEDTGPLHDAVQTVWDGDVDGSPSLVETSSIGMTLANYKPAVLARADDSTIDQLADQDPATAPTA